MRRANKPIRSKRIIGESEEERRGEILCERAFLIEPFANVPGGILSVKVNTETSKDKASGDLKRCLIILYEVDDDR